MTPYRHPFYTQTRNQISGWNLLAGDQIDSSRSKWTLASDRISWRMTVCFGAVIVGLLHSLSSEIDMILLLSSQALQRKALI